MPPSGRLRASQERAEIRYDYLDFRIEGPIATVVLDRPESGNRIDRAMAASLREMCRDVEADDSVRVLIVTGAGSTFSVGREEPSPDRLAERGAGFQDWLCQLQVASSLAGLPIPVIAAVNGEALDHGLELALAADLRIAAVDARFGSTDLGRGTFPWDGGTQRLPRSVGPAWARDMIFTGRIIEAPLAQEIGLINRVAPGNELLDRAMELAESIVAGAPVAARYAKEAVRLSMDLTLSQGLALEADLNILLHTTADREEGIKSFLERRKPEFRGE